MPEKHLGAELYTVRQSTKTASGVAETFKKVADIGYKSVEIAACDAAADKDIARMTQDVGLAISSAHTPWKLFLEDIDAVIDRHKTWQCVHTAVGGLPKEYYCAEGVKRFLDELAGVAEKLAAAGMDFSYHNHSRE
ncbi:MAG: hypothetical protein J7M14_04540, partial [Planctomycetes bacterium]|nr:hypothetical protein [Planctomycetota bacterium]